MTINTVFLVTVCLALVSCGKVQNTLVLTNHSGVTANQVLVTVCKKDYVVRELKNGDSRTQHFKVTRDSGFLVSAALADGTTLTNEFGYVTGGAGEYGNRAEIEITKDRKIVGKQQ